MLPSAPEVFATLGESNIQCILDFAGHEHYRCLAFNKEWRDVCIKRHLKSLREHSCRKTAINFGSLAMLRQACEEGYLLGQGAVKSAAAAGSLECLQWAHNQLCSCAANGARTCCLTEVIDVAAESGNLQVLNWLLPYIKHQRSSCIASAAGAGKLEAVQFLLAATKQIFNWNGIAIIESAAVEAADGGHLQVLEWLHSCTSICNDETFHSAAAGGHVHVLEWLHVQQEQSDDLLKDKDVALLIATVRAVSIRHYAESAAAVGHVHVSEWYNNRGHKMSSSAQDNTFCLEERNRMYVVHHLDSNGYL
eukprot:8164-Heterococcus_DN1.PRE.20